MRPEGPLPAIVAILPGLCGHCGGSCLLRGAGLLTRDGIAPGGFPPNSHMSRRIVDAERPHPDDVRNSIVIAVQVVAMSVVNLMAGALAGIGASMFVANGQLRWPSSQVPLALIVSAISLVELIGVLFVAYLTRPTWAWIEDSSVFRSYLRQVKLRGWVGENRADRNSKTSVKVVGDDKRSATTQLRRFA